MFSEKLNIKDFIACLSAARTRNIGPKTFLRLIEKYHSPQTAFEKIKETYRRNNNSGLIPKHEDIIKEIEETDKAGGKITSILEDNYPENLRNIDNPPIVISYLGDLNKVADRAVALVGSRNCSANSVNLTYQISKQLAESNFTVISGLARGIDTAAHKGALDFDGKFENFIATVAVLGGGIDHIYPKENKSLFERISSEGLIISENPIKTAPKAENFPRRNRIISALSRGTVVMEGALKSGSLITARLAAEQGKEVMAVPGFPLDKRSEGTNKLIKNGAHLVGSAKDIIEIVGDESFSSNYKNKTLFKENNNFDFIESSTSIEIDDDSTSHEFNMLETLNSSPVDIDYLIKISGLKAAQINSMLLEHEIMGEIIRHHGNKVSRAS